jgi:hypothetical protein
VYDRLFARRKLWNEFVLAYEPVQEDEYVAPHRLAPLDDWSFALEAPPEFSSDLSDLMHSEGLLLEQMAHPGSVVSVDNIVGLNTRMEMVMHALSDYIYFGKTPERRISQ